MNWININDEQELVNIKQESQSRPVLIYKHSTRCPISGMALSRLERSWSETEIGPVKAYFLDLVSYKSISNKIAEIFAVRHESPQILLIRNGDCIYHTSHMGISYRDLKKQLGLTSG